MIINKRNIILFIIAIFCSILWYIFSYPQLSFIDLKISRHQARNIAKDYLNKAHGVNPKEYLSAVTFHTRRSDDRYLQRALGFKKEIEFIKEHHYELFHWQIRFFQEQEYEEFVVYVSAATGEIAGFSHKIEPDLAFPDQGKEIAKQKVWQFLKKTYQLSADNYEIITQSSNKRENRTEYTFKWAKKDVFVKWSQEEGTGGAKYLIGATITGDEILSYVKQNLDIPPQFSRFIAKQMNVGSNLGVLFRLLFFGLLTASVFYVIVRRNNIVLHSSKNFCITLTAVLFGIYLLSFFNEIEEILNSYPTTASFASFLWRYINSIIFEAFIVTIGILMPCLSGISLHYEVFKEKATGSFLRYIRSTFLSRDVSSLIAIGYLAAIIMAGLQSVLFAIGQRYCGVWVEYYWMTQHTDSYWPFLGSFFVGIYASVSEEITFRLFSISLFKKLLKRTLFAVVLASVIWGYGHSTYPIFPMWFRGIEVTCLGLLLSWFYLRFGIITVLVAHYLFDTFWCSSPYLFGKAGPFDFLTSFAVLALPGVFALIAYALNKSPQERALKWQLSNHQIFNLDILKFALMERGVLLNKSEADLFKIKKDIISHGWDIAVVEMAFEELLKSTDS